MHTTHKIVYAVSKSIQKGQKRSLPLSSFIQSSAQSSCSHLPQAQPIHSAPLPYSTSSSYVPKYVQHTLVSLSSEVHLSTLLFFDVVRGTSAELGSPDEVDGSFRFAPAELVLGTSAFVLFACRLVVLLALSRAFSSAFFAFSSAFSSAFLAFFFCLLL